MTDKYTETEIYRKNIYKDSILRTLQPVINFSRARVLYYELQICVLYLTVVYMYTYFSELLWFRHEVKL